MAVLTIPNSFTAGTSAIASQVNQNFTAIKNFIDTNLVQVDGTVKAGPNALENIGTANMTSTAINFLAPTGSIIAYAGASAPSGYLLCDGTEYSQTGAYAALFAIIGTAYNTGGETAGYFRVPNLKGRVPFGLNGADADFDSRSDVGGSKAGFAYHRHSADGDLTAATVNLEHTHSADGNLAAAGVGNHSHGGATVGAGGHDHNWSVNLYFSTGSTVSTTLMQPGGGATYQTSAVGDHAHGINADGAHGHDVTGSTSGMSTNITHGHDITGFTSYEGTAGNGNLPPYLVVNYIIKW